MVEKYKDMTSHPFTIISGADIAKLLPTLRGEILKVVEAAYILHDDGLTNNPDSYFLRFPERPQDRIIALPASMTGDDPISGIKWIASYPQNIERNLQRASAVLLLNDYDTGYPLACLEASQISSARTAASAVVAARALAGKRLTNVKVCYVGAGVIARTIHDFFVADGWGTPTVNIYDLNDASALSMCKHVKKSGCSETVVFDDLNEAISQSDIIVFATNASEPYVMDSKVFSAGKIVLNISLRDIGPEVIHGAFNICDDVEHCMKANTSPHLTEQKYNTRSFVHGTIAAILKNRVEVDRTRPLIVSPFGLGVLDLAVGSLILRKCLASGAHVSIPDFIADVRRWPDA